MPATFRKLPMVLPLMLFAGAACWGQTTIIEGTVKGEDGKPLKDAVVKIERLDIKANYHVKSDKKGHYLYAGLPIGTYNVSVEVNGQKKDEVDKIRTSTSDNSTVDFDLQSAAARSAAGAPAEAERNMTPEQKAEYEKSLKEKTAQINKNKALNDAFNAGKDAATAKNWDAAVQSFQKATELDPNQDVVWANLADAYVNQGAAKTGAEQKDLLDKGIAAYQKAIALKPDDPVYHNNYALALAKENKFAEAQTELTKTAQLDPSQAGRAYYNLGAVLVNTGQLDPAADAFRKAISIDPNYADAHYQLGISLMGKATTSAAGKITPAPGTVEEFQKYLELQPNGPNAETAKAMLAQLGETVQTNYSKQPQKKK